MTEVHAQPPGTSWSLRLRRLRERPVPLRLVATGAAAAVAVDMTVIAAGGTLAHPTDYALLIAEQVVGFALAGYAWGRLHPGNRESTLLYATGAGSALQGLQASPNPTVHSLAVLADFPTTICAFSLLLSFPAGRTTRLGNASLAVLGGAVVVGFLPLALIVPELRGGTPLAACAGACPPNPLAVLDASLAQPFRIVAQVGRAGAALLLTAALLQLLLRATSPRRRTLAPIVALGSLWALLLCIYGVLYQFFPFEAPSVQSSGAMLTVARAGLPVAFLLVPFVQRAYAGGALELMVRRLDAAATPAEYERVLAAAVGDPTLWVAFPGPSSGAFVDARGEPVDLRLDTTARAVTRIERDGVTRAAIVHDPALQDDRELLDAAARALLLALEDGTPLDQSLLRQLRERGRRLLLASATERRELERELHRHTQQQLAALRVNLELTRSKVDQESPLAQPLAALADRLDETLLEVRRMAADIYPQVLEQAGLGAALTQAVRTAELPVTLELDDVGRYDGTVESAVYFSIVEGVRNAIEHGGPHARVRVTLGRTPGALRFTVEDDGKGFRFDPAAAFVDGGGALATIRDRMAALDGNVHVRSESGIGTVLAGVVPARRIEAE